jgi:linoleoyl-CoA desaturase
MQQSINGLMKKVKFISTSLQEQDFAAAVRKNVNDYFNEKGISTKGNFMMTLQTIAMLSVYIVPLVLILTVSMSAWIAMIMTVLIGIGMAGVGMSYWAAA